MMSARPADPFAATPRWMALALLAGACVFPLAAHADSGPGWQNLSPAQQQALAPLRQDWSGIDATRKQKWLEVAGRFDKMPSTEKARIQQRMAEWARLPVDERMRVRQQFQESRRISADERQARWLQYQALPPEERQQLADQAQQRKTDSLKPGTEPGSLAAQQPRLNVMPLHRPATSEAVSPGVVQARPGVTTTTVATRQKAAPHQQVGLPKIAATPDFVEPATLLPRRGAQAAARIDPPASAPRTPAQ